MKHWTGDHGAPLPRAVCAIEDGADGMDGGAPPPPPRMDAGVESAFRRRDEPQQQTRPDFAPGMEGGLSTMDAVFGRRRQDPEGTSRAGDRAAALEAARQIREGAATDDGQGDTDAIQPAEAGTTTESSPAEETPSAPPAIDYNALAQAYFDAQARQNAANQQARLTEETTTPKRRLLAPDDTTALARHLATQVLGPAAENLADEDLDAIGREQIEILRLTEAVKEWGDDPEHGPRLKQQLAQREQKAYARKIESALAERDQRIAQLEQRLEDIAQAPQRQQQETQVRMQISQQLAGKDFAQALPTLHQLAASGEDEAGSLADEIMSEAKARGVDFDTAAKEIEQRYARVASRFQTTATAAGQTRTQARPNVTQRDAAGSPTRPHPEKLTREEWEARSRNPHALREYALQGARERRRDLDRG